MARCFLNRDRWTLQTPPHGDAPSVGSGQAFALLLTFGSARTWCKDFHLARSMPCLALTPRFKDVPASRERPLEPIVEQHPWTVERLASDETSGAEHRVTAEVS